MKTLFLISLISICVIYTGAQQNNSVVIGNIDTIHSQILKEERTIWVHVPASLLGTSAKKKYPVVYLLDGEWNFTGVVGMIDLLSSINGNNVCPEMIVVGIPNTNRTRDLTPTRVTNGLWVDSNIIENSGGGENFTAFIEKELIPHIDSLYQTSRYRVLIGHSLGGLTVMNTLLHHRTLFSSYVAIDPSMWWDKQRLLHETEHDLKTNTYKGTALYLAMANTLPEGLDTISVQRDTTDGTIHPRSILQLEKYITAARNKDELQAGYKYYNGDGHSSVPLIATYDALHFIFNDYPLVFKESFITDSSFRLASYLQIHYETISSKYGITSMDGRLLPPAEDWINGLGSYVLSKKQVRKAEELFKLNVKNYPESFNAYVALGDLYASRNDKANAKVNYRKSLSLKESAATRQKLDKMEGK